jgi:NAD-dependent DNA ligase
MLDDLSIVIYDTRFYDYGEWRDYDWTDYVGKMSNLPIFYHVYPKINEATFEYIYNSFSEYRETCPFALDGIVIKPTSGNRISDLGEVRPKDCVAVKFIPMLEETEIVDIEWNTGKTNELHPVIIVNPVVMDGKQITRASAHNYGFMKDNKISIGTKVILSLAGDIIPFIYKVTNTDKYDADKMQLPEKNTYIEDCHLYKVFTPEEYRERKFIQSANALNIPNIGPSAAKTIYDYMITTCEPDEFLGIPGKDIPYNILECSSSDINNALGGKLGANASKAFDEFKKKLTLSDVIMSCTFESCGRKIADAIQEYLLFGKENFEHMATKAYEWALNTNSLENIELYNVLEKCGKNIDIFRQELQYINETKQEQIPVILTGEPNNYPTKDAFLRDNPQYRLTGSWKEVKIVFTNSLDSKTGKMKKAIDKGIEIRLY